MNRIILALAFVLSACLVSGNAPYYDLQTAINTAPNGGTVLIPCGVYDIGTVYINAANIWQKVVTIQGCGHAHLGQSPTQGHTQWDYLINGGYVYGTVLRGSIVVDKGVKASNTSSKLYLRDVSLIGYGSGVGLDYGDGVNMYPEGSIENVSIGNYDIGIRLRRAYYITIDDVSMSGVGIGLQILDSNVITVSGLNIGACGIGLDVTGNGNSYTSGSVQTCMTGAILGGSGATFNGFYFEQISGASLDVTGRGHDIGANCYASNAPRIQISGHNNRLFTSEILPSVPVVLTGNYNRVELPAYGVCSDTGYKNQCTRLFP